MVDTHTRDADVVVGDLASGEFVVVRLWTVIVVLEHFTEVGPGRDVFIAFGGIGTFDTIIVLTVKGVVHHFCSDFKLSVRIIGWNQFTRHLVGRLIRHNHTVSGLGGVRVGFIGIDFNVGRGSHGDVADALDIVATHGGAGHLTRGFHSNVNLSWVERLRAVSDDGQLELCTGEAAGVQTGSVHFVAVAVKPSEVDADVVPVFNDDVHEFGVVGGVCVNWAVNSDFDHVFAHNRRPNDVGAAALKGHFATAKESPSSKWTGCGVVITDSTIVAHYIEVLPNQIVAGCVLRHAANGLRGVSKVHRDGVRQLSDVRISHVLDECRERDLFTHL